MANSTQSNNTVQKTNSLAIVGFILAFLIPIVGFVLSIVGLSQIKKSHEQGRGLAIAGIVISSFGTLIIPFAVMGGLLLGTSSVIQQKARDTERSTDLKAIASRLEVYKTAHGYYPSLQQLNDDTFRAKNFPGLDREAYRDPQSSSYLLTSASAPHVYTYLTTPGDCNDLKIKCTAFILSASPEEGQPIVVNSVGGY